MSKEREAFEKFALRNQEHELDIRTDDIAGVGIYSSAKTRNAFLLWQAATSARDAHYQPLLEAKDAEIADLEQTAKTAQDAWEDLHKVVLQRDAENIALKTLLEQAREGLLYAAAGKDALVTDIAIRKLAVINAAGEK